MLFSKNKTLRFWCLANVGLVLSHLIAIWSSYIFIFIYKQIEIDVFTIFWAVGATVIILIYFFDFTWVTQCFYSLWNRSFLTVVDYQQWYFLNRFLVKLSLLSLGFTFFFAVSNIKVNFETIVFSVQNYLIYLIFMPIIIFNGFVVWYNYKYIKIIKNYQKETDINKISLVR